MMKKLRLISAIALTTGVMLGTEHGTMQGHYDMIADDGTEFAAPIAPFVLAIPRTLH